MGGTESHKVLLIWERRAIGENWYETFTSGVRGTIRRYPNPPPDSRSKEVYHKLYNSEFKLNAQYKTHPDIDSRKMQIQILQIG